MSTSGIQSQAKRAKAGDTDIEQVLQHYLQLLLHRKWLVLCVFLLTTAVTCVMTYYLPDIYMAETLILVDPQKVPESYVKPTVTGDVRNRLGTLSQQILSATRLQKIIETHNLYAADRQKLAREDVITRMRGDISVKVVSEFGRSQDLQAFRITYSGKDPGIVAQVTNQLASLFIEENLKAREQQATGTTEFLQNQLEGTRKTLEEQEGKLKEFKLRHMGELPEQQSAILQVLGQMQSQLQLQSDALGRVEQQRNYVQSLLAAGSAVVDVDDGMVQPANKEMSDRPTVSRTLKGGTEAKLAALLQRYTEDHPEVRKLKEMLAEENSAAGKTPEGAPVVAEPKAPVQTAASEPPRPVAPRARPAAYVNPVLQTQIEGFDVEITKHKEEVVRLRKLIAAYQSKLGVIPMREQEMTQLVRDYEISKVHYQQLLEKQLSAETATQLEIRQKGEKFAILDPAQIPQKPSKPNRFLLNLGGSAAGLILGIVAALATEVLGMCITTSQQMAMASGTTVLEVIPLIETHHDRLVRRKRILVGAASAGLTVVAGCGILLYHYRNSFL